MIGVFVCLFVARQIVKKTLVGEGEAQKAASQMAGEIMSFFTRNNFAVADRGETITYGRCYIANMVCVCLR